MTGRLPASVQERVSGKYWRMREAACERHCGLPVIGFRAEMIVTYHRLRQRGSMFMEHCHNTMHEDNAMLLRWEINAGQPFLTPLPTPISKPTGVTFQSPDEILPNA